ncbi:MAG: Peptide deformylase [Candidatus Izimaplasma bacterium HR2]|nr:MAG: Peptide deformylase [Candidatus Izimaplasma bacterium HR2]
MLTMKDVIREGHPTLAMKAKDVELPLSTEDKKTLKLMMEFLENGQDPEIAEEYELRPGVGLAAPQINISKRMLVVFTYDETGEKLYKHLLVNPKIMSHSIKKTYLPGGEGCLSVDREVEGITPRHKKITLKSYFYNTETEELTLGTLKVSGYVSVVFQHEIDHLNGILFVDKLFENIEDAEPVVFPELEFEEEFEERDL